jgi:hypothetical protein
VANRWRLGAGRQRLLVLQDLGTNRSHPLSDERQRKHDDILALRGDDVWRIFFDHAPLLMGIAQLIPGVDDDVLVEQLNLEAVRVTDCTEAWRRHRPSGPVRMSLLGTLLPSVSSPVACSCNEPDARWLYCG